MLNTQFPAASPAALRRSGHSARLLRAIRAAQLTNPRNAGTLSNGITITSGSTIPSQTPKSYLFDQSNLGPYHVIGGKLLTAAPFNMVCGAIQDASATRSYTYARIEFTACSQYVTLKLGAQPGAPYRVLVNGQYIDPVAYSGSGYPFAPSSTTYYLIDFGIRANRRLTVEGQSNNANFLGAYVESTGMIFPVSLGDAVHAVMLGDSYVQGLAAAFKGDGIAVQLGDWMGVHMQASGVGGTGWNHANRYDALSNPTGTYGFDQRIANGDLALSYYPPDIIFLMASVNDRTRDTAAITAHALAGLRAARARHPEVPIIVFGCCGASYVSTVLANEAAVQTAVTQFADPLCVFVPVSSDPNGPWVSGSGYAGNTGNDGISDWATTSDGTHPTDEGCAYLGRRYAAAALKALGTLYPTP